MGLLTHKQLISLLESDSFDLNQITTPDNIRNLLIERDNNSQFIGHIIAIKKEQKTLLNFFDLVQSTAKNLVHEVSTQLDKSNQTIGHKIAFYQKPEALDRFLQWVATHAPESLEMVLSQANVDDLTIGHIIANQRPKALDMFLQCVVEHAPASLTKVLTQAETGGWTMGHFIAHYQKPEALDKFLQVVVEHAPESLEMVLTQANKNGWTMVHFIPLYQKPEALDRFLQVVVEHAPDLLVKVLTETTGPAHDIIDIIISNKSESAIYQLLKQEIGLSTNTIARLAPMKKQVFEHMKTLPLEEQISSCEKALDKTHPLGILFHVQRGFFPPRAEKGTLHKIAQRYFELRPNNYLLTTPSNHIQMSMFNTTSPETAAKGSHMDTETYNSSNGARPS